MKKEKSSISEEQLIARNDPAARKLILATPGAGKTRLLISSIGLGIRSNETALVLIFNKKAEEEVRAHLSVQGYDDKAVRVKTFHAYCLGLVNEYDGSKTLDINKANRIIWQIVKEEKDVSFNAVKHEFSNAALQMDKPYEHLDLYEKYVTEKEKQKIYDFSDLHPRALELLENPKILEAERSKQTTLYVDEGHDLNKFQIALLRKLTTNKFFGILSPEQSVYGFRGAAPTALMEFTKEIGAKVFYLTKNFRSSLPIVTLANSVMMNEKKRNYKAMIAADKDKVGSAKVLPPFPDAVRESEEIADDIFKRDFNQCMVLYRVHKYSAHIERSLAFRDLPYFTVGSKSFFQLDEVAHILAYLKTTHYLEVGKDREAKEALKPVLNVPFRWLSRSFEEQFEEQFLLKDEKLLPTIYTEGEYYRSNSRQQGGAIKGHLQDLQHHLIVLTSLPSTADKIAYIRGSIGYDKYVLKNKYSSDTEADEELLSSIDSFTEIATRFDTLEALVKYSKKLKPVEHEEQAKVILMTAHASKGREIDDAYVIGSQQYPFSPPHIYKTEMEEEEERNLFFVAVSRAKTNLTVSAVGYHTRFLEGDLGGEE